MSDHYDRLETRSPSARESALFRDLRHVLTVSKPRAPALRAQLKGIDVASLQSRDDLARIPLIRRQDLQMLQAETAPFGGLATARPSACRKIFLGPGAIASEGHAKDWWGLGRALFAAGLRKGSLVLNCFAYDLVSDAHMIESGAAAIGCPVIPAGQASLDLKLEAIQRLRPSFYSGPVEALKTLLDHANDRGIDVSCLTHGLVTGMPKPGLRSELEMRGVAVRCALLLPEFGLVAFETGPASTMCIAEGLVVEIVTPGGATAAAPGTEGEIVVSRINPDYPLLRYATGLLSVAVAASPSGYTNMRIRTPRPIAPESALCGDTCIHTAQVAEIRRHHPDAGPMHLVIGSWREKDALRLRVERRGNSAVVGESLSETLHRVTRVRGTVEFVEPGSLSDEDAMLIDERPLN